MQLPRTITHFCFNRVSAQDAEKKLLKQRIGSYIIRPTTSNPDKLSVTWKIYHNVYRHFRKLYKLSLNHLIYPYGLH